MSYNNGFHAIQVHVVVYEGLLALAQDGYVVWRMVIYPTIKEPKMWKCCEVM